MRDGGGPQGHGRPDRKGAQAGRPPRRDAGDLRRRREGRRLTSPLGVVDETGFAEVAPADLLSAPLPTPLRTVVTPTRHLPAEEAEVWFAGRVGGPAAARWASGDWRREGETALVRAPDVVWIPPEGAVISGGAAVRASLGHRLAEPDLPPLPDATRLARRAARRAPLGPSSVFMGRGARLNYGHFLLDGLTGLLALEEAGVLASHPPLAPPLRDWQRQLLALAFPGLRVREVSGAAVRLAEAVLPTTMDHHLHWPNGLATRLAARVRAGSPATDREGLRLYLSRRGLPGRVMVGEAELERRLRALGFTIVHAERLSAAAQASLARDSEVIVGPTGAAMANALFASPRARVVEIQPECFASAWAPAFRRLTGGDWAGYITPAPAPKELAPWSARLRRGFRFAYAPDLDDLEAFVRARL